MTDFLIGSHIKAQRFGYTHHGIYVGQGQVIHFSGLAGGLDSKAGGTIEQTALQAFQGIWSSLQIVKHTDARYSGQEVVDRARTKLGEKDYNLAFNNCEHFATWCVTGEKRSKQVNRAAGGAVSATSALGFYLARKHAGKKAAEAAFSHASTTLFNQGGRQVAASIFGQVASKTALKAAGSAAAGTGAGIVTTTGASTLASTIGIAAVAGKSAVAGGSLGGPVGVVIGVAVGVAAYGVGRYLMISAGCPKGRGGGRHANDAEQSDSTI